MKRMKYATKKAAKEILDKYKNQTSYFDGEIEMENMKEMFRYMGFGEAETNVILASLVLTGCKFRIE